MRHLARSGHIKMLCLTLHRPWGHAIIHGTKRIENRTWKPPLRIVGQFIYIHSGKIYSKTAVKFMKQNGFFAPKDEDCPTGIIGIAEITGYTEEDESPWFFGPYGWTIGKVWSFAKPIDCPGKQGLWKPDLKLFEGVTVVELEEDFI